MTDVFLFFQNVIIQFIIDNQLLYQTTRLPRQRTISYSDDCELNHNSINLRSYFKIKKPLNCMRELLDKMFMA